MKTTRKKLFEIRHASVGEISENLFRFYWFESKEPGIDTFDSLIINIENQMYDK